MKLLLSTSVCLALPLGSLTRFPWGLVLDRHLVLCKGFSTCRALCSSCFLGFALLCSSAIKLELACVDSCMPLSCQLVSFDLRFVPSFAFLLCLFAVFFGRRRRDRPLKDNKNAVDENSQSTLLCAGYALSCSVVCSALLSQQSVWNISKC